MNIKHFLVNLNMNSEEQWRSLQTLYQTSSFTTTNLTANASHFPNGFATHLCIAPHFPVMSVHFLVKLIKHVLGKIMSLFVFVFLSLCFLIFCRNQLYLGISFSFYQSKGTLYILVQTICFYDRHNRTWTTKASNTTRIS